MTYYEKLKDPRWQKKRLEILERDFFTCQNCCSPVKELHVHHFKYGKNPWDIDNKYLITFCKDCHEKIQLLYDNLIDQIIENLINKGCGNDIENTLEFFSKYLTTASLCISDFGVSSDNPKELNISKNVIYEIIESIERGFYKKGFDYCYDKTNGIKK